MVEAIKNTDFIPELKHRAKTGISFVREGEKFPKQRVKPNATWSLLNEADDWRVCADLAVDSPYIFPIACISTTQRPDLLVWSPSMKRIVIVELTVPADRGVVQAKERKDRRYAELVELCIAAEWKTEYFSVSVTTYGHFCRQMQKFLKLLGLSRKMLNELSSMALRASYLLYLYRTDLGWHKPHIR